MITKLLLILSIILTIICYLNIIIKKQNKNKDLQETAANTVTNLTKEDNSLHLVENKNGLVNKYLIKRKMIKLTTNTYYSKNPLNVSIAYLFSGYSKLNVPKLNFIGKIIPYIYYVSFIPLISIALSLILNSPFDAKIGLVVLIIFAIYQYIINITTIDAINKVTIKEDIIKKYLKELVLLNNVLLISTILQVIRFALIILER